MLDYIVGDGVHLSPSDNYLVNIKLERRAHVRPVFELGLDDVIDSDKKVSFNVYRRPEDLKNGALKDFENGYYDLFLSRSLCLEIPYSPKGSVPLCVKSKEDLLATKIARGRPKDLCDALSLVKYSAKAGEDVQYPLVEEILCNKDQRGNYSSEELCNRYRAFMKFTLTL